MTTFRSLMWQKIQLKSWPQLLPQQFGPRRRAAILDLMRDLEQRVEPDDLLVVYFGAHAGVGRDGVARLFLPSSEREDNEFLTSGELNAFVTKSKAKYFAMFLDIVFGLVPDSRLK